MIDTKNCQKLRSHHFGWVLEMIRNTPNAAAPPNAATPPNAGSCATSNAQTESEEESESKVKTNKSIMIIDVPLATPLKQHLLTLYLEPFFLMMTWST